MSKWIKRYKHTRARSYQNYRVYFLLYCPILSVTWPFLDILIGQFQRQVKIYGGKSVYDWVQGLGRERQYSQLLPELRFVLIEVVMLLCEWGYWLLKVYITEEEKEFWLVVYGIKHFFVGNSDSLEFRQNFEGYIQIYLIWHLLALKHLLVI